MKKNGSRKKTKKKLPMLTNVICFWFVLLVFLIFSFRFLSLICGLSGIVGVPGCRERR